MKNAQLAAAQDKFIHLAEIVGQFYCDLAGTDENAAEMQRVRQIQKTLRELADQNADSEEKRSGSPPTNPDEEAERDARSPKIIHAPNISRTLLSSDFIKEVSTKLNTGLKLDEVLNEADYREKLAEETEQLSKSYDSFQELFKLVRSNTSRLIQSKATNDDEKSNVDLQQQLNKYKSLLNVKRFACISPRRLSTYFQRTSLLVANSPPLKQGL